MSSIRDSRVSPARRKMPTYSCCSAVSGVSASRSAMPRMAFIGVRISWLMLARKALLASERRQRRRAGLLQRRRGARALARRLQPLGDVHGDPHRPRDRAVGPAQWLDPRLEGAPRPRQRVGRRRPRERPAVRGRDRGGPVVAAEAGFEGRTDELRAAQVEEGEPGPLRLDEPQPAVRRPQDGGHPLRQEPQAGLAGLGAGARGLAQPPVGDRGDARREDEGPVDGRPLPRVGQGIRVVEHGRGREDAQHAVVQYHVAEGQQEGHPVVVQPDHREHHEEVEVRLDVPAGEVHQHRRGRDQAQAGHGAPPASPQAGMRGDQGRGRDDPALGGAMREAVPRHDAEEPSAPARGATAGRARRGAGPARPVRAAGALRAGGPTAGPLPIPTRSGRPGGATPPRPRVLRSLPSSLPATAVGLGPPPATSGPTLCLLRPVIAHRYASS